MTTSDPDIDFRLTDRALEPVADKIRAGAWLAQADGETLFATRDLHGLGRLANFVRESLHQDKTFYNRNRHINYTNVCALSCKFCSFYRKRGEEGAYEMPVDQVIAVAKKAAGSGATEVHIVGGLHPWLKFDYYLDMMRGIRRECPDLHIKAFTAIEIIHFGRIARLDVRTVLSELKNAGLGSLPGGGAEIFDDRVHDEVFKGKVKADRWFDVHRTAHQLGLFTNATMLYGHVETVAERVGHLIKLRELQQESLDDCGFQIADCGLEESSQSNSPIDEFSNPESKIQNPESPTISKSEFRIPKSSAHFNCLIPLSFIPDGSELGALPGPTGLTDLKTLAIARLMVPNIAHLKAFWIMQGVGLSQVSLDWGVDDLDGTVVWYDITKREGHGSTHQELHEHDLRRLIREAGRTPVERDTLYHEIVREPSRVDAQLQTV